MSDPTSATIAAFCQARAVHRATMLARPAPTGRAELVSPYVNAAGEPIYTPDQLAMQRKIAILRYNKGLASRKKVNAYVRAIARPRLTDKVAPQCPSVDLIPTLSTGMNVPGPAMVFTYDPSVPIYMYQA